MICGLELYLESENANPSRLAQGQINPNIVGFGQTFECNSRSDEEFYRTDDTFVIDPKNPDIMYVNAEYLGLHKSIINYVISSLSR